MDENKIMTPAEETESFLPEGYSEGSDIFDMSSWGANGSDTGEDQNGWDGEMSLEELFTIEDGKDSDTNDGGSGEEALTMSGDDNAAETPKKLKFKATYNHNDEDVEIGEEELPNIWQKAKHADDIRRRYDGIKPMYDRLEVMAKNMGYESVAEMVEASEKSMRDGEIEKLTSQGVHPDVAADLVDRRHSTASRTAEEQNISEEIKNPTQEQKRDFKAEIATTVAVFPESKGKSLPNEVIQEAVSKNIPLVEAYAAYRHKQNSAEMEALKRENDVLKQNAKSAARAPVSGVSRGGATDTRPTDPFLSGFNSY